MDEQLHLFVVDDDSAVSESIQGIVRPLGLPTECFQSAEEFLEKVQTARPGCLILDVRMQGMSGLELQAIIQERGWPMPVIIVTGHADIQMSVQAMQQGAVHFLEKPYKPDELRGIVQTAIQQAEELWATYVERSEVQAKLAKLSAREKEVCDRLVDGRGTKEIAFELGISPSTVEKHRLKVFEKLNVDSVPLLIRFVIG